MDEQATIMEKLHAHDAAMREERETLRKLRLLKAALDGDVLTGVVRADSASLAAAE